MLGIGNSVSHLPIKSYLKLIKEGQAKARIAQRGLYLFLEKLQMISQFNLPQLRLIPTDLTYFPVYFQSESLFFHYRFFFSGHRSSDRVGSFPEKFLYFPDSSGILFMAYFP